LQVSSGTLAGRLRRSASGANAAPLPGVYLINFCNSVRNARATEVRKRSVIWGEGIGRGSQVRSGSRRRHFHTTIKRRILRLHPGGDRRSFRGMLGSAAEGQSSAQGESDWSSVADPSIPRNDLRSSPRKEAEYAIRTMRMTTPSVRAEVMTQALFILIKFQCVSVLLSNDCCAPCYKN
jgi:hypothetical protein